MNHNLRSNINLKIPIAKTETLKRSFIPTAVGLWNKLDKSTRTSTSIHQFKTNINKTGGTKVASILYYYGKRWPSIHHARLRLGCSKLNSDVCYNLHIPDINPECSCGNGIEDAKHFFLSCPNYANIRVQLKNKLEEKCKFYLQFILYGSKDLSDHDNMLVFDAVHEFISRSQRFI